MAFPDPPRLAQWLDATIGDLEQGRTHTGDVLRKLHDLNADPNTVDPDAAELLREVARLCDGMLEDQDSDVSGLVSVLERFRRDPSSAAAGFGLLHLDPDSLAQTDELTPRYEVRHALGKGGMGEVRAAFDRRVGREVALKRLLTGRGTAEMTARFLQEAQITGQLEHPHIVPVYDIGVGPDTTAFFTMKQVRGKPLDALVKAGTLTQVERLDIFKKVCDAVAFAHARGVVHRDLKPANVMVGAFGQVFVLDWGLAKLVVESSETSGGSADSAAVRTDRDHIDVERTSHDQIMGTPAYMAPEQARGDHDDVDALSDVYALGGLLYVLLTGQRPFARGPKILERVRNGDFPPAHQVAPVARELSAIISCAMALDKHRRYTSVHALKADVERWQQGDPVSAYHTTVWRRTKRMVGRHGRLAAAAAAALLVLSTGTLFVFALYALSLGVALDQAVGARQRATAALADSHLAMAVVKTQQSEFDEAHQHFASAQAALHELGVDSERADLTRAWLAPRVTEPAWRFTGGHIEAMVLSPDGRQAIAHAYTQRKDGVVVVSGRALVLDLPTGRVLAERLLDGLKVYGIGFLAGAPFLAMTDGDDAVLQTLDGQALLTLPGAGARLSGGQGWITVQGDAVYLSDGTTGTWAFSASDGAPKEGHHPYPLRRDTDGAGPLRRAIDPDEVNHAMRYGLLRLDSGEWLQPSHAESHPLGDAGGLVRASNNQVEALAIDGSPRWRHPMTDLSRLRTGGGKVLAMAAGRRVHILDHDGTLLGQQNLAAGPSSSLGDVSITPDGRAVLIVADGQLSMTWLRAGTEGGGFQTGEHASALAISPDGWLAAVAHRDGIIALYERTTGIELQRFDPGGICTDVAFDGAMLLASCRSAGLLHLPVAGGEPRVILDGAEHPPVTATRLDGTLFAALRTGELVRVDASGIAASVPVEGGTWDLVGAGQHLLLSSTDHGVPAVFAFTRDLQPVPPDLPNGRAYRLATLPDGGFVASDHRGRVRRIHPASGTVDELPVDTSETVMAVAVSPDGRRLIVGRYSGTVEVFDLERGHTIQSFPTHPRAIVDLAWSPAGPVLLTGGGIVETLDAQRAWPEPLSIPTSGPRPEATIEHLVRSAVAADAWPAVASLVGAHPEVLHELPAETAVRAALAAGDRDGLEAALIRVMGITAASKAALRGAVP